jgi:hypothetical protein
MALRRRSNARSRSTVKNSLKNNAGACRSVPHQIKPTLLLPDQKRFPLLGRTAKIDTARTSSQHWKIGEPIDDKHHWSIHTTVSPILI